MTPREQALRLGTRGSQLALWQARTAAALVEQAGGPPCEIVVIRTSGDRLQEAPLSEIGGKRLFVKEIEDALLRGEVDFAVHSCKDMPAVLPDGPRPSAACCRARTRATRWCCPAAHGRPPASVEALAAAARPAAAHRHQQRAADGGADRGCCRARRFAPIRGNLDTRLRKLDAGDYDALVLAAAGMRRLGFADRISFTLPVDACVPAPGQGAIAIELRADDARTREAVGAIDDPVTARAVEAERALVAALGGGCQTPIGAVAAAPTATNSTCARW